MISVGHPPFRLIELLGIRPAESGRGHKACGQSKAGGGSFVPELSCGRSGHSPHDASRTPIPLLFHAARTLIRRNDPFDPKGVLRGFLSLGTGIWTGNLPVIFQFERRVCRCGKTAAHTTCPSTCENTGPPKGPSGSKGSFRRIRVCGDNIGHDSTAPSG